MVVGSVVLLVSAFTKYPLGIARVLPFTLHSAGDYLAAALLFAAPFALTFNNTDSGLTTLYIAVGVAVVAVSLITNYQYSDARPHVAEVPVAGRQAEAGPAPEPPAGGRSQRPRCELIPPGVALRWSVKGSIPPTRFRHLGFGPESWLFGAGKTFGYFELTGERVPPFLNPRRSAVAARPTELIGVSRRSPRYVPCTFAFSHDHPERGLSCPFSSLP